mgnify:CR=1 FL=1
MLRDPLTEWSLSDWAHFLPMVALGLLVFVNAFVAIWERVGW